MSAPKFTPGPWRSVPTTTHGIDPATARRDIVSDGAVFAPAFVAGDVAPEHAALICASPDLYEALAGLLSIFDSVTMGQEAERRDEWVPKARAALAKATQP